MEAGEAAEVGAEGQSHCDEAHNIGSRFNPATCGVHDLAVDPGCQAWLMKVCGGLGITDADPGGL